MDKKVKQIKVAQEIVSTETTYVTNLEKLHTNFFLHAKVLKKFNKEVMTEKEISQVFMNLEEIFNLNKNMCNSLVELRYKGDEELVKEISQTLLRFTPFLKIYGAYTEKYQKAVETIEALNKKPKFREFVAINEAIVGDNLHSLMILPVQRVPRYILLMKELIKCSDRKNPEVEMKLQETVNQLEKMANTINSYSKTREARDRVITIQREMFKNKINIIEPHRYVIAMGIMPAIERSVLIKQYKDFLFVLFNDFLLIGRRNKRKEDTFKPLKALPLERFEVQPLLTGTKKQSDKKKEGFIISSSEPGFRTIEVIASNTDTRNKWVKNIMTKKNEVTNESKRKNTVPPTFTEFENKIFMTPKRASNSSRSSKKKDGERSSMASKTTTTSSKTDTYSKKDSILFES